MKWWLLAGVLVAIPTVFQHEGDKSPDGKDAKVLLELFTSEGCSSCPPADETLIRLKNGYGEKLVVLGFHVDYWDQLGWKDAFSDAAYSSRQKVYASALRLESIYTPEVVINGTREAIGSDEHRIREWINEEIKKPAYQGMECRLLPSKGNEVQLECRVHDPGGKVLHVALVQLHAETKVEGGENKGRLLIHANIVRSLESLSPDGQISHLAVQLPPGLQPADCHLACWLQDSRTQRVLQAEELALQ